MGSVLIHSTGPPDWMCRTNLWAIIRNEHGPIPIYPLKALIHSGLSAGGIKEVGSKVEFVSFIHFYWKCLGLGKR